MSESSSTPLLRRALVLDAIASGAMAMLLVLAAPALSGIFGLSAGLLRGIGFVLLPWVALLAWTTARPRPSRGLVLAIVGANVAWVLASAWLPLSGLVSPTTLGTAFVVGQAVAVAVFADLQWIALRRNQPVAA
ncbi:MAG TPA: hypothetical protein VI669_02165 [Vicinamibacteria bacterium]